jgi:hypothetical protein
MSSGGNLGTGGSATGGTNPSTGGSAVGGAATGGTPTGTGGKATGGTATGGVATGGNATGGKASGGTATGGTPTGGTATGGVATGGNATGGTVTGGTATGGKATGGTATGGSGGGCSVAPVTPNASQQARNLLCYLYSQYGNHVLSGQQETSWSSPASDITWYTSNGMQPPAVLGGDYLYDTSTTTRAIAYWDAGGISMIRYHMGMPPNADSYANSQLTPGSGLLDQVVTPGNSNYTSFVSKLDYVATQIQRMKDVNAPVLLALFHEYQPGGWFWWSKGTAAQFIKLWTFTFNYLTTTKGLNNIVWLAPSSGSPNSSWYPGKAYIDVAGPDTYATNQPFTSMFTSARNIIGTTVPITLHETGLIPNPANMFPSAAPWILWNIWASYQKDGTHNTTANIQAVYANSYTVTRNEIPSLK